MLSFLFVFNYEMNKCKHALNYDLQHLESFNVALYVFSDRFLCLNFYKMNKIIYKIHLIKVLNWSIEAIIRISKKIPVAYNFLYTVCTVKHKTMLSNCQTLQE